MTFFCLPPSQLCGGVSERGVWHAVAFTYSDMACILTIRPPDAPLPLFWLDRRGTALPTQKSVTE